MRASTHSLTYETPVDPLARYSTRITHVIQHLRIWDIQTGNLLRGFSCPDSKTMEWPFFRWSHDGSYIARQLAPTAKEGPGIAVYALPDLKLVDGKPMTVAGLKEFVWSPGNNYIAYWTPEEADAPARVTVVDVATRAIVRTKNFFMVSDVGVWARGAWRACASMCSLLIAFLPLSTTRHSPYLSVQALLAKQRRLPSRQGRDPDQDQEDDALSNRSVLHAPEGCADRSV